MGFVSLCFLFAGFKSKLTGLVLLMIIKQADSKQNTLNSKHLLVRLALVGILLFGLTLRILKWLCQASARPAGGLNEAESESKNGVRNDPIRVGDTLSNGTGEAESIDNLLLGVEIATRTHGSLAMTKMALARRKG